MQGSASACHVLQNPHTAFWDISPRDTETVREMLHIASQDSPDAISLRAWLNSPWTSNLGEDIFKGANLLTTFVKVRLPACL